MIYLDSAATTLQKPYSVSRAVTRAIQTMTTPGRGSHPAAMSAASTVFACRELAADLFGVPTPEQVVFTGNATHGLNVAIHSVVRPGDRVLISGYEHNAVTRPLYAMDGVEVAVARAPLFDRKAMLTAFEKELSGRVSAVVCTHVSNVFGFVMPVEEIAGLCRDRGIPLILDASQSAGSLPISLEELGAAFIAMPGHKGLYGPQGTGLLLCRSAGRPLLCGGTGSASRTQTMPEFLPDRLEAGTHNVPGIAGLLEGLRFVKRVGTERVFQHEHHLIGLLARSLERLPGVEIFCSREPGIQSGVLSLRVAGRDCEELGEAFAKRGVALRAGLHCAPLAHESAGTLETGTLRLSVSAFTGEEEVRRFGSAARSLLN